MFHEIRIDGFAYKQIKILNEFKLQIPLQQRIAIIGPNGAGKSTLLKILANIYPQASLHLPYKISYLPQSNTLDKTFPFRVRDLVAMGAWHNDGDITKVIAALGLCKEENKPLWQLSGGQFQRALFARMLLQDGDWLLLDEPFVGVDQETCKDILKILCDMDKTILIVLHDTNTVCQYFPYTISMQNGTATLQQTCNYNKT